MKTNHWIDGSNRLFDMLLKLYPRDHRDDYAGSMRQVFSAQCKEAFSEKGFFGLLVLWLRVLPDMGYTAIVEHLTSPKAAWGLLEPVPNAPLPWKGVFLVLLPGLVYLVSQIAQLNGEPWYLTVYYRAAFFLIIPVLVVWAVTRKFPIWGLIPVGLLFRLVQEIGYQMIVLNPGVFSSNPVLNLILDLARLVKTNLFIPAGIFLGVSVILAVMYFKKNPMTRGIKVWGLAFALIILAQIVYFVPIVFDTIPYELYIANVQFAQTYEQADLIGKVSMVITNLGATGLMEFLQNNLSYLMYQNMAILCLIMLGTLFTRRHGFFTIFILVGYYLPVMLVGTVWGLGDNPQMLVVISVAVLLYRVLLTLIAPVWMCRTEPLSGKKKVILSCILLALVVHFLMQFFPSMMFGTINFGNAQWMVSVFLEEMLAVTSFLLGAALYQNTKHITAGTPASEDKSLLLGVEQA
jgi:hypothetical protein